MKLLRNLNGLLGRIGLHVSRESSFRGLQAELLGCQERLDETSAALERETGELKRCQRRLDETLAVLERDTAARVQEELLKVSQLRWRDDEPDAGLTWGVPMIGDEFVRFLCENVQLDDASTIVEVGPGYGRVLDSLLNGGVPFGRYIGLELSSARVGRLRDRFDDPRIEFREADLLGEIDLAAVADLTFASAVFEHLYPDFSRAMNTISGFTRPSGAAVVDFVRFDDYGKSVSWFEDEKTYIRVYSPDELKMLFAKSGFDLHVIGTISFGSDINNREIKRDVIFGTKRS